MEVSSRIILLSDTRLTVVWLQYLKQFCDSQAVPIYVYHFSFKLGRDSTIYMSQFLFMNRYARGIQHYAFEAFD